ncbi:d-lactaldehyde dehydrogenase [Moniliophthora roreri]|nr:d-lactaldehyde dehydrogenase [Moniliophthora roreri]
MPAINDPDSKILVTGGNGYLGAWIVDTLLQRGHFVVAVVRNESKGKHLRETFKYYGDKFQLAYISELEKEGAFDEVVQDVHGIIHVASPVRLEMGEPSEIIDPAVKCVTGLLHSVLKHGTLVKRIVFTSSAATIYDQLSSGKTLSEADCNDSSIKECEERGKDARPIAKYMASKILAERAAWDIWRKSQSTVQWDLSAIIPVWVFGPHKHDASKPEDFSAGTPQIWYWVVVRGEHVLGRATPGDGWVDVRDCAEAHVRALEVPAAGGERILTCAGSPFKWQDFLDTANAIDPPPYHTIAKTLPSDVEIDANYNSSKAEKILGLKYRMMEELTRDTLADYTRRGW